MGMDSSDAGLHASHQCKDYECHRRYATISDQRLIHNGFTTTASLDMKRTNLDKPLPNIPTN
jgi:hypothetical protein